METLYWVILVAVVAVAAFYGLAFFWPSAAQKLLATATGPFELNKQQTVASMTDARSFVEGPEASVQAFVYLNPMLRSGVHVPCGTSPGAPSCADGTYTGPCPCVGGDCVSSCPHPEYYPVMRVGGVLTVETLIAPDASRPGQVAVQMTVKTEDAAGAKYLEIMILPPLAHQKWQMLTVAREGRRFDVYYNDALVSSQKTLYMPSTFIGSSGIVTGGEAALNGQVALFNLYNYRLSSSKVYAKYHDMTDTRGQPHLMEAGRDVAGLVPSTSSSLTQTFGKLGSVSLCPEGGCFEAPTVRPASPLYEWSSSYE